MPIWIPPWNSFWTKDEFDKYPIYVVTSHPDIVITTKKMQMHTSEIYQTIFLIRSIAEIVLTNHIYGSASLIAKLRGIKDGDLVRVYSGQGEVVVKALVTARITPGVANLPEGRWADPNASGIDRRGCANTLTYADRGDPTSFHTHPIAQIERF